MTTIKDLLFDFAADVETLQDDASITLTEEYRERKTELVEEYETKINRAKELEYANKS